MSLGGGLQHKGLSGILERLEHSPQHRRRIVIVGAVDEQPPRLFVALLDDLST